MLFYITLGRELQERLEWVRWNACSLCFGSVAVLKRVT
jgi:hypothetical protein